jgi:hypothetical protein
VSNGRRSRQRPPVPFPHGWIEWFETPQPKEYDVHKLSASATALLLLSVPLPAIAADNMSMGGPKPAAMMAGYHFELAAPAQSAGGGKSIVSVRLVHDGKPVAGAIVIQSQADMGPIGMAGMTAPIKTLGEKPPGTYRFEVENGPVWKKADNWALSFGAKVQGVAQTVTGSVTVKLTP